MSWLKPFTPRVETVNVAACPTEMVCGLGVVDPVKSPPLVRMPRKTFPVCTSDPLVEVMVSVQELEADPQLFCGVAVVVKTVKVEVPEPPWTVAGLNDAVVPGGSPLTLSATSPVNPPMGVNWKI